MSNTSKNEKIDIRRRGLVLSSLIRATLPASLPTIFSSAQEVAAPLAASEIVAPVINELFYVPFAILHGLIKPSTEFWNLSLNQDQNEPSIQSWSYETTKDRRTIKDDDWRVK